MKLKKTAFEYKAIVLAVALLVLVACICACKRTEDQKDPTETTEESESVSESASETSSGTSDETPTDLTLFENGKTEYTLVRPDNATSDIAAAAKVVYDAMNALLDGTMMNYQTDFVYSGAPVLEKEILLGETSRAESAAVYAELAKINGNCYIIKAVGEKIVIAGTNTSMLNKAVEYFVNNYLTEKEGRITMSLTEEHMSEIIVKQPYTVIDAVEGDAVAKAVLLGTIERDGDYRVAQGACTDGKHIYIILENQNTGGQGYKKESHYCKIVKLDAKTLETVKVSEPLLLDHGNDCTYNSDTNEIVVAHNAPNKRFLSFVDADTLELKRTDKNNTQDMYAIAYHAGYKKYVVGISSTYDYGVYSNYPKLPKRFAGLDTGYIKQGLECDDKYVYFVQYKQNVITVHDWEGHHIRTIEITNVYDEPEAIFYIGDQMYMTSFRGRVGGSNIYRLDIRPKS